jgi:alpha-2-macroglobulin
LEQRFNGATWRNRTDYLWSIAALKKFVDMDDIASIDLKTTITLDNRELASETLQSYDANLEIDLPIFESPLADLPREKLIPLRIDKSGTGNLYYSAQIEYALPSEAALPRDEGICVFLQYETLEGENVEPDQIETGETYRVRTVVSSSRRRSYMTLDVAIPSGMEIVDSSFATTSSYRPEGGTESESWTRETAYGDEYTFTGEGTGYLDTFGSFWWYWKNEPDQKIFDNHLTYEWETFYEGKRELTFLVRATSPGIYPTPPAQASLLYEPEVFGRTGGALFVIR